MCFGEARRIPKGIYGITVRIHLLMTATHAGGTLHKRVLKWGNSYGIRLTKADLERLGLREDDEVDVGLEPAPPEIDWASIEFLRLGSELAKRGSLDHDEIAYEGWLKEQEEKRNAG